MKNKKDSSHYPPVRGECCRTRLAESSVAAVDVCSCGMMQLHIGALTMRLAPCAVSELLATLGEAVAEHTAREYGEGRAQAAIPFLANRRGDA